MCAFNRKDKKSLFSTPVTYVQFSGIPGASGTSAQLVEMIPGGLQELRSDTITPLDRQEVSHVLCEVENPWQAGK